MSRGRPLESIDRVVVTFRKADYEMNLTMCRYAFVNCMAAGDFDSTEALADLAGVHRGTLARFFQGRPAGLRSSVAILARLRLRFEEVFTPCAPDAVISVDQHGRQIPMSPPAA